MVALGEGAVSYEQGTPVTGAIGRGTGVACLVLAVR